ncbi:DNA-directed RNA polymerase subunit alpha C-terminal domain-containing protein [Rubripirellula reticaptiva]|uniref:DNA-directed RNA polymerase subunit alpha n=1 Tax=Rubripirellula reticaptiva TaxID=2528013 RepID=A0A5C6F1W6_9BACT|nr:DNA-directed RNA polymerase subunit alpha C-terminal domain-containing protein [Rubripirellula reticaptiva]TWU55085.1 DNA-directed RNA polymerase subunit alpha [Rubripirellula reticaptiva]
MTRIPLSRVEEESRLRSERLDLSIAEMELSVRTTNCLEETGILTVRDLLNATPRRLLSISNFGEKTLDEVYAALESLGFYRPGRQAARV